MQMNRDMRRSILFLAAEQAVCLVGAGAPIQLTVHPSSVLFRCRPAWIVYGMVQETAEGGFELQEVTAIEPEWLMELAPHMYKQTKRSNQQAFSGDRKLF
eukprot:scaffold49599_cov40-Prasinocladus_malaysianus.AAC.2